MITIFEKFSELKDGKPKKGDYVILDKPTRDYKEFYKNNIGEITLMQENNVMLVKFDSNPKFYEEPPSWYTPEPYISTYRIDTIKYWSSDKADLEEILDSKKYNI